MVTGGAGTLSKPKNKAGIKRRIMAKSLKLVIFDCDGTLVDSQHMILAAMREAYGAHALPVPDRETLLSIVGLSLPQAFAKLGNGAPDFPVASLCDGYRAAFQTMRAAEMHHLEPLYPGAATTVAALAGRDNIVLGIATGKSQRGVRGVLARHGLLDHFITIKTADDAPSKPDPGMVLHAMHEAGVAPADTVMIGDTVYDIMMARAAGAAAIGVTWGYHTRAALVSAGAPVIDDFAALAPALDKLWTL
jgi:phosphoglycolate phosphatase